MSYVDVFIPLVGGFLLITQASLLAKRMGGKFGLTEKKLRIMGIILMGVALVYLLITIFEH